MAPGLCLQGAVTITRRRERRSQTGSTWRTILRGFASTAALGVHVSPTSTQTVSPSLGFIYSAF